MLDGDEMCARRSRVLNQCFGSIKTSKMRCVSVEWMWPLSIGGTGSHWDIQRGAREKTESERARGKRRQENRMNWKWSEDWTKDQMGSQKLLLSGTWKEEEGKAEWETGREGGRGGEAAARQKGKDHLRLIHYTLYKGRKRRERKSKERKKKRERLVLRWGGRGGGASVGEAEGCVLAHMNHSSPFLPVCVPLASVSFGLQNRKVGAKSDSAPAATRHSQQLPPLWQVSSISLSPFFFFTALSLIQCLSFTHTHTHRHTHTLRQTLSHTHIQTSHTPGRGEDRTTGEVLHTFTTSYSPSHRQTLCPGCGRFSWGSPLDYWPPPGRSYFKVRGPCLRPADGSLFGDFF